MSNYNAIQWIENNIVIAYSHIDMYMLRIYMAALKLKYLHFGP